MNDESLRGIYIAKGALEIGAIKLRPEAPFVWASGYQMPIYNDNRMFLFHPDWRGVITESFERLIERQGIPHDVIAGTSTSGIPWATSLADRLSAPMVYVRDKPKDHGLKNQIEGIDAEKDLKGYGVALIEDLISTGGSSADTVRAVRNAGGECNNCLAIFSYGLDKAVQAFASLEPACAVHPLLTYEVLLDAAKGTGYLNQGQVRLLEEWRADPFGWGANHGFPKIERGEKK